MFDYFNFDLCSEVVEKHGPSSDWVKERKRLMNNCVYHVHLSPGVSLLCAFLLSARTAKISDTTSLCGKCTRATTIYQHIPHLLYVCKWVWMSTCSIWVTLYLVLLISVCVCVCVCVCERERARQRGERTKAKHANR